jgi:hypothetical protein
MAVDHTCNNRACIRYEHLEAVTQVENMRRAVERRTHCRAGHEYTDATTYWHRGTRHCRPCNALAVNRYALRKRSESSSSTGLRVGRDDHQPTRGQPHRANETH